jgi:hypothetical protein
VAWSFLSARGSECGSGKGIVNMKLALLLYVLPWGDELLLLLYLKY